MPEFVLPEPVRELPLGRSPALMGMSGKDKVFSTKGGTADNSFVLLQAKEFFICTQYE
ncbi:hypothetical protein MHA01_02000 [Marinococcus halophilus]|uniref:Uncharacterized protein n=1 Tax=Marinococcus halophilus TaxID=1371 RepID=A0A510Y1T6_MARHA|nr:hypothetical protein MHA01_02000 [Marinococcus halophilus]